MDYDRIQREVEGRVKALFFKHFPDGLIPIDTKGLTKKERRALLNAPNPVMAAYRAEAARLAAFKNRLRDHRNLLADRARRNEFLSKIDGEIAMGREAIAAGKVFMAFDCERTMTEVTKEVGVTIYRSATGTFESYNYRLEGMKLKTGFSYGTTQVVTMDELRAILVAHANEADFYVGHSLTIDFEHLRAQEIKLTKRRFFDTMWFSHALFGEGSNSLSHLAERYGIAEGFRAHNGGNDARKTMEVFLQMVA